MYPVIPQRYRRYGGYPSLYEPPSTFDSSRFGYSSEMSSGLSFLNSGLNMPNIDIATNIEQATRRHFGEAKTKMEECEKKMKDAERLLYFAKYQVPGW
ncbi:hypothetical protein COCCADRAFT_39519 [Bipolaris zeicola 26-R-13]|uniref:Uncharacterized protein n=1 Tax=Cochliobolus carbonum (strain 26-R-13) TaxID=930089 RepID=W6XY49_COCC2|nr:uncharacterized protein COCCADRAFT_39519 [Bipolaris zeicola 26-R-13]EUC30200.1 hypothetical protein COCCADRAFT_39519 [Bipolaris zeicola 26-R-13]